MAAASGSHTKTTFRALHQARAASGEEKVHISALFPRTRTADVPRVFTVSRLAHGSELAALGPESRANAVPAFDLKGQSAQTSYSPSS